MIVVREIQKSYGNVRAVRGVGFEVPRGVVAGLLGPNGAGKSTLIRIVTGFLPPDAGRVSIAGRDAARRSLAARKRIGYLPESAPLHPEMRAVDYLRFRARLYRVPIWRRRAAVASAIDRCGLRGMERRRIGHLSRGYRQRVGLAAAIVHDPPVVILDEPTSGLDPVQIREVRALIRELGREKAVLMSSHILAEVERTCDRIIVLARGRVRAEGTAAELIDKAGEPGVIEVEFAPAPGADGEAILGELTRLPGVESCTARGRTPDGWARAWIRRDGASGVDPRESVASAIAGAGGRLRELRSPRPSLERVFLRAIEEPGGVDRAEDGGGPARPAVSEPAPAAPGGVDR